MSSDQHHRHSMSDRTRSWRGSIRSSGKSSTSMPKSVLKFAYDEDDRMDNDRGGLMAASSNKGIKKFFKRRSTKRSDAEESEMDLTPLEPTNVETEHSLRSSSHSKRNSPRAPLQSSHSVPHLTPSNDTNELALLPLDAEEEEEPSADFMMEMSQSKVFATQDAFLEQGVQFVPGQEDSSATQQQQEEEEQQAEIEAFAQFEEFAAFEAPRKKLSEIQESPEELLPSSSHHPPLRNDDDNSHDSYDSHSHDEMVAPTDNNNEEKGSPLKKPERKGRLSPTTLDDHIRNDRKTSSRDEEGRRRRLEEEDEESDDEDHNRRLASAHGPPRKPQRVASAPRRKPRKRSNQDGEGSIRSRDVTIVTNASSVSSISMTSPRPTMARRQASAPAGLAAPQRIKSPKRDQGLRIPRRQPSAHTRTSPKASRKPRSPIPPPESPTMPETQSSPPRSPTSPTRMTQSSSTLNYTYQEEEEESDDRPVLNVSRAEELVRRARQGKELGDLVHQVRRGSLDSVKNKMAPRKQTGGRRRASLDTLLQSSEDDATSYSKATTVASVADVMKAPRRRSADLAPPAEAMFVGRSERVTSGNVRQRRRSLGEGSHPSPNAARRRHSLESPSKDSSERSEKARTVKEKAMLRRLADLLERKDSDRSLTNETIATDPRGGMDFDEKPPTSTKLESSLRKLNRLEEQEEDRQHNGGPQVSFGVNPTPERAATKKSRGGKSINEYAAAWRADQVSDSEHSESSTGERDASIESTGDTITTMGEHHDTIHSRSDSVSSLGDTYHTAATFETRDFSIRRGHSAPSTPLAPVREGEEERRAPNMLPVTLEYERLLRELDSAKARMNDSRTDVRELQDEINNLQIQFKEVERRRQLL